jgi:Fur family transcriptional regulator, ferric uptake regulator
MRASLKAVNLFANGLQLQRGITMAIDRKASPAPEHRTAEVSSSAPERADSHPGHRSELERLCRDRGLRMTGQRLVIARVLDEAHDHPNIDEVYRRAVRVNPQISLATVYRTVKKFAQLGMLERHAFRGGPTRLERSTRNPDQHHDHLIDVTSGRVVEFRSDEIERLQVEIAKRLGFRLVGHRLELYAEPENPVRAKRSTRRRIGGA